MSTLQERLDRIREGFMKQVPPEIKAIMDRGTVELQESGIMSRIPMPGDKLPPFELPDTEGNPVRSAELLQRGPMVLTFYRGVW